MPEVIQKTSSPKIVNNSEGEDIVTEDGELVLRLFYDANHEVMRVGIRSVIEWAKVNAPELLR